MTSKKKMIRIYTEADICKVHPPNVRGGTKSNLLGCIRFKHLLYEDKIHVRTMRRELIIFYNKIRELTLVILFHELFSFLDVGLQLIHGSIHQVTLIIEQFSNSKILFYTISLCGKKNANNE